MVIVDPNHPAPGDHVNPPFDMVLGGLHPRHLRADAVALSATMGACEKVPCGP